MKDQKALERLLKDSLVQPPYENLQTRFFCI